MDIEKQLEWYEKNYTMNDQGVMFLGQKGKKEFIGSPTKRICRFCGKDSTQTTFLMEAHAIPEFLGNHSLISNEECDECNTYFSETLEDNFAKYLQAFRTLSQISGKKGVPSYKSADKKSCIRINDKVNITTATTDFFEIDEVKHEFLLKTKSQPYIPREVYRCIVKTALSLLSLEELKNFQETLHWIRYVKPDADFTNKEFFTIFMTFTSGPRPYKDTQHLFFKRKDDSCDVPYMSYMLCLGNLTFQIILPCPQKDNGRKINFIPFPTPYMMDENKIYPYDNTILYKKDFSGIERITEEFPISMHYDHLEK